MFPNKWSNGISDHISSLNINPLDNIITIREFGNANANFILIYLLKQVLLEDNKVCFLTTHNISSHYAVLFRKLGYDVKNSKKSANINFVELLSNVTENIDKSSHYLSEDDKYLHEYFISKITDTVTSVPLDSGKSLYIVIDDASHMLDIGLDLMHIINFLNCLVSMAFKNVKIIIGSHVCCKEDEVISNYLGHVSDVTIDVHPFYTGKSTDVSGSIGIVRLHNYSRKLDHYHFKSYDRGIRIFPPGQSVQNLYK